MAAGVKEHTYATSAFQDAISDGHPNDPHLADVWSINDMKMMLLATEVLNPVVKFVEGVASTTMADKTTRRHGGSGTISERILKLTPLICQFLLVVVDPTLVPSPLPDPYIPLPMPFPSPSPSPSSHSHLTLTLTLI